MQVTYIIESRYYNGEKYADKLGDALLLAETIKEIARQDVASTPDDERIDSKQISVTTEEA